VHEIQDHRIAPAGVSSAGLFLPEVAMARGRPVAQKKRDAFLEHLRHCGCVLDACRGVGLHPHTLYRRRKSDPEFAAAWEEALEIGLDVLESEALRRAMHGDEEPVFYQGQQVGVVRKRSDALLMFLLRTRRPAKYRERVGLEVADDLKSLLAAVDGITHDSGAANPGYDDG